MNDNLNSLRNAISGRRTVKPEDYTGEKVDDEFIKMLLEEANWAPTHGYTEPWRFTVFKEEGLASLGEFMATTDQPDKQAEDFNAQRYERLRTRPLMSSHVIGIGLHPGNNPKVPEIEEICSVAISVQNMWLMAYTLGLGAYWSTGPLAFRDETRAFFGLPKGDKSLGFFYIGKPAKAHPAGHRLSPIEEKVRWVNS